MKTLTILFISCLISSFSKGQKPANDSIQWLKYGNVEFYIIKSAGGEYLQYGNFFECELKQIYSNVIDTVLSDTQMSVPYFIQFDSANMPIDYYRIISQLKTGDSTILRVPVDTVFNTPDKIKPAFVKSGGFFYTYLKLIKIFTTPTEADKAKKSAAFLARPKIYAGQIAVIEIEIEKHKAEISADGRSIEAYLLKNKLHAFKTTWGTYISIIKPGSGEQIDNNKLVTVNYTGRAMGSSKVFDSNTKSSFNHVVPLEVNTNELTSIITGWSDALLHFKKGTKAVIFIPSALAYGNIGVGELIKAGDILIFDMEILNVKPLE